MWWPTPLPQELAQSSLLNDEKVKNVITYSCLLYTSDAADE